MKYTKQMLERRFRKVGDWERQGNDLGLDKEFTFAEAVKACADKKISKTYLDRIRKCQPGCHAKLTNRYAYGDQNDYVLSLERHWNNEIAEMEEVEESLQGAISIIDKKITEEVGYLIDEKAEFVKYNQAIKEKLAQKRNLRKNKYKEG